MNKLESLVAELAAKKVQNDQLPRDGESIQPDLTEEAAQKQIRPYYRARPFNPAYDLQKEEPHHREICELAAQGYTNKEIAQKTGWSPVTIAYVKKQPWALEHQMTFQNDSKEAVIQELKGAALEAAQAIIDVMRNKDGDSKACDRAKAANSLLDRLYGTATQHVMHESVDPSDLTDAELIQELQISRAN